MNIRKNLYLPADLVDKLKALAKVEGRTMGNQLARILRQFFAKGKK